ncbi:formyltransferase family protein [Pseudodesulfovibrio thermohalotolerans]|uniref:formyltransferase family protein n=1 Tax=Pseudodesulfovibrio thermohalotolerans TaxID=2880651 RepID=UPI0022B9F8B0|nr:formyltransferase family protein [Pseudodesulfovibrio thermohalotolerans]WFS61218.1 formyltransferase family protein [Pseudodesulfovibrio thermohalotolerans]
MEIQIVTTKSSWLNDYIETLVQKLGALGHDVRLLHDVYQITACDIAFYLSCNQLVPKDILSKNSHNLVVHASCLPKGRGWSPMTWQILEGENTIPITLFEAEEHVDSGQIYLQKLLEFEGHELIDELREALALMTIELCEEFVVDYHDIVANAKQQVGEPTYYPRRVASDSRLDPNETIAAQFNLLRVVDNESYPAYFELNGHKYTIKINKADD